MFAFSLLLHQLKRQYIISKIIFHLKYCIMYVNKLSLNYKKVTGTICRNLTNILKKMTKELSKIEIETLRLPSSQSGTGVLRYRTESPCSAHLDWFGIGIRSFRYRTDQIPDSLAFRHSGIKKKKFDRKRLLCLDSSERSLNDTV